LGNPFRPSPGKYGHYEAYEDGKTTQLKSSQAQLNKAFSTKLDGRYVLALIDTKGELPEKQNVPDDASNDYKRGFAHSQIITTQDILMAGYKKVVHVFGEGE
jgi:hypothetical protein